MAHSHSSGRSVSRLAVIIFAAVLAAGLITFLILRSIYISVDGQLIRRDSSELKLEEVQLTGVDALLRLENPASLDLRGEEISAEDFDRLQEAFPDCAIRWDVPVGGERFDSGAESIVLHALRDGEERLFAYFTALRSVDASAAANWPAVKRLHESYPALELRWNVTLGGESFDADSAGLTLPACVTMDELRQALPCFEKLTDADASALSLTAAEMQELQILCPGTDFAWTLSLGGKSFRGDAQELDLRGERVELSEVLTLAPMMQGLKKLDMTGCGFSNDQMLSVVQALPQTDVLWSFEILGVPVTSLDEEVDFSNIEMENSSAVEAALPYLTRVKKIIMSDCGISDEDMDALNNKYEDIRFVWTIHFGNVYYLRTDETYFIAALFKGSESNYSNLYDKNVQCLKYCVDMEALDLGHMSFTDLSFLRPMKKLRYLILADSVMLNDISPLADLPELYYLEIFNTGVQDVSPLLNCRNLRHLNVCYCYIFDKQPLLEMTWLDRLWFISPVVSYDDVAAFRAVFGEDPDKLQIGTSGNSTGGTWRYDQSYYDMRDALHAYYMPGGTMAEE